MADLEQEDLRDEDSQFVLNALLRVLRPILEEDLRRGDDLERLAEEAVKPVDCEEEFAFAQRIFEAFFTEEVATRLLPPAGRQLLGPAERWRWCYLHIRCCIIFGFVVCRGPRTFRNFSYYLKRYWRCVREVLGRPLPEHLGPQERQDFHTLVQALAGAYKPFLSDQLASVEFPDGLPDEVLDGRIDCHEGEEEFATVFERLLTPETAVALLGREAFEAHSQESFFWFCRCWCLCAIRFGCCLAHAKTIVDVARCVRYFRYCLRHCFRPLHCELLKPTGCTEEELVPQVGALAVPVFGTASGAFFKGYTLQWRRVEGAACDDDAGWQNDRFVYPGGGTTGTAQVTNGILGWMNTTTLFPGSYEIRVCVFSTQSGATRRCCCIQFNLFKKLVWIDHVAGAPVQAPPGPFVSTAPIVTGNPGGVVQPVGCCVTVSGSAFVGDCNDRKIKCFDLRYGVGFLPGPGEVGFTPASYIGSLLPAGPVCYEPPEENDKRAPWNNVIGRPLTTRLVPTQIDLGGGTFLKVWKLEDRCFSSEIALPPCPDASHGCRSGKYTLLLDVEDTKGNHYYDTQQVWFDNKPLHVEFEGLEGLPACTDLGIGKFVPGGAPCTIPWPMNALGIVYDEYIDPSDLSYPSDNFDSYDLTITKQTGQVYSVPITSQLLPMPLFGPNPLVGTTRVGDPGTRCEQDIGGCPVPPFTTRTPNTLTQLDLRIFDAVCAGSLPKPFAPPPGFALDRGACCGYSFQLSARDKTRSDSGVGACHSRQTLAWAVCICNDLDKVTVG